MQTKDLGSWQELVGEIQNLRARQSEADRSMLPLLFRGQRQSSWKLDTTLERAVGGARVPCIGYYRRIFSVRPEIEAFTGLNLGMPSLDDVHRLVSNYDELLQQMLSGTFPAYAYMAHLRHHGFPSPLLDWSRSPYVAAFFAFRSAANDGETVSIFALSEARTKFGSSNVSRLHRLGPVVQTHRRHFLQQSEYTLCLAFDDGEWRFAPHDTVPPRVTPGDGPPQNFELYKFNLPTSERAKVLRDLDQYNLNAFSLFGSEESLMETLAFRKFGTD